MRRIVRMKFQQNPALREALLDTGNLCLINGGKGKRYLLGREYHHLEG